MTLISTYSSLLPARLWLAFVCVIGIASGTWRNVQFVQAHAESLAVYNLGVDAATYEEAAQRLARRPRLRLINAAQPPGFVMALGLIHRAFGPERLPIKQIFCGLVALTACLAWWIGCRSAPLVGALAGVLVAWSPMLQAYCATLQYEVPAAFLCTLTVALTIGVAAPHPPGGRLRLLVTVAAVCCAVSALTREVLLVLFPVLLVAIVRLRGVPRRERRILFAATLGIGAVLVGGWVAYQSARAGRLIPISDKGSVNLRIGNNPNANGTYNLLATGIGQPAGFSFMASQPRRTVVLFWRKALYFSGLLKDGWNVPRPVALYLSRATGNLLPLDSWLMLFRGGGLSFLSVMGAVMLLAAPRVRGACWPAAATLTAVLAVHVLTLSSHRFALPVWPLVAVLASIPLARAWHALGWLRAPAFVGGVAFGVWAVAAQGAAPPGRYSRAAAELDGDRVSNAAGPGGDVRLVRIGAASEGRRMIALDTAELIGRGFLRVAFGVRAGLPSATPRPAPDKIVADLLVSDDQGHVICASALTWSQVSQSEFRPYSTGCRLPTDTVLSVALWTRGIVDLQVDAYSLSFGHARPEDVLGPPAQSTRLLHRAAAL